MKKQLHVTALTTLQGCGHRYYLRYIKDIHRPRSTRLAVGTAAHKAIARNLTNKAVKGELLDREEVDDIAAETINEEAGKEDLTDDGVTTIAKKRQGELVDESVAFSRVHYDQRAPFSRPAIIEQEINGEVQKVTTVERPYVLEMSHYPFNLAGTIDLLDNTAKPGKKPKFAIRDNKTARKMPNLDTAKSAIQLTAYAMATRYLDDQKYPIETVFDYLVIGRKTKDDEAVSSVAMRNAEDEKSFLRIFELGCKTIETGLFMPAEPGSFLSPCGFCEFRFGDCRFYSDPKTAGIRK